MLKKNFLNHIYKDRFFFLFFFLFIVYYFFNFNLLNDTYATDYQVRYKPNGNNIVNILKNLQFSSIDLSFFFRSDYNFINPYLVPELITGLILNLTSNENIFSIFSNILNMILLFLSFYIFFKPLNIKNKDKVIFFFLIFFFLYPANWIWCFWKLADVYFLFIFSVVFYFLIKGIQKKNSRHIVYALIFAFIATITKPQGIIIIPFCLISIFIFYCNKINFFKFIAIFILIYFVSYPALIFILIKMNYTNIATNFMLNGNISGILFYKQSDFFKEFSLLKNNFTELLYYYFLFFKKIIYQLIFLRETYSLRHNIFLVPYTLILYFFLIINLNYLLDKYGLFFKLSFLISIFSILLHSSLGTADEPNRHQLFHLIPLYILATISFNKKIKEIKYFLN
jgi:hypothetical protein